MERSRFYLVEGLPGEGSVAQLENVFSEYGQRVSRHDLASLDEKLPKIQEDPLSFVVACDDLMKPSESVIFYKNDGCGPTNMSFKAGVKYLCYPPLRKSEVRSQHSCRSLVREIIETALKSLAS